MNTNVTRSQIDDLRAEALRAGDHQQAALCRLALGESVDDISGTLSDDESGELADMTSHEARHECERVILAARAAE